MEILLCLVRLMFQLLITQRLVLYSPHRQIVQNLQENIDLSIHQSMDNHRLYTYIISTQHLYCYRHVVTVSCHWLWLTTVSCRRLRLAANELLWAAMAGNKYCRGHCVKLSAKKNLQNL